MSKLGLKVLFALLLGINIINGQSCGEDIRRALTDCDSGTFEPNENTQFVICTNECDECIINCDDKQVCEELIIVSGAGNFELICDAEQACKNIRTFVGEISQSTLNNIGLGSCTADEFERDSYGDALVECFDKQACEGGDTLFRFIGNFTEVCVTADNDPPRNDDTNEDRIKDATIIVDIGDGSFKLDCGIRNERKNCDSTTVDCDSSDCICEGQCRNANLMGVERAAHTKNGYNIEGSNNLDKISAIFSGYFFYICIAFILGMIMCCIGVALYWIISAKQIKKNKYQRIKLDTTSAASSTATSEISDINF